MLTSKQQEYVLNANKRWNVRTGATGAGKTYLDIVYTIAARIRERAGKDGLIVLLGNTRGTLQRNIIDPMRERFGDSMVSPIRNDNTATLFGETVYCLGADKANQVSKLQGATIKYAYGDEVTTWNESVFTMLKSRLRTPCSCFDGTCNPDNPHHWFKEFLDSDADIYQQSYTIDDNPTLPEEFVRQLKKEYFGTVYYQRFILGLWAAAEGAIYQQFANNPNDYIIDVAPYCPIVTIGVDFGGNGSANTFNCTGFANGLRDVVALEEYYRKEIISPTQLENDFVEFVQKCRDKYTICDVYCDSAEQTLIRGLKTAAAKAGLPVQIHNAYKGPINDRIRFTNRLISAERFKIMRRCTHTIDALSSAVWDKKHITEDVRLDDGTYNVDNLDSFEYSFEPYMKQILARW